MKRRTILSSLLLASGPLLFPASDAQAGYSVPANPTLNVTTSYLGGPLEVSFSGDDWCGSAYYAHGPPFANVTCGHTVFVGIWQLSPEAGGLWATSVTLQSSPGGFNAVPSRSGTISGNLVVGCGSPNGTLYALDLDDGTVLFGPTVNPPACLVGRLP